MGNVLSELIAVLGLVVAIIAASDQIVKNFRYVGSFAKRIPYIIFEVLVIAMSGLFISAILWIVYDYVAGTKLELNIVLITVASGAAWGMPVAVLSALSSKNIERTIVTSLLISMALLLLYDPTTIISRPNTGSTNLDITLNVMYSITMLIWTLFMGVASGYIGFKTKIFVEGLLEKSFTEIASKEVSNSLRHVRLILALRHTKCNDRGSLPIHTPGVCGQSNRLTKLFSFRSLAVVPLPGDLYKISPFPHIAVSLDTFLQNWAMSLRLKGMLRKDLQAFL